MKIKWRKIEKHMLSSIQCIVRLGAQLLTQQIELLYTAVDYGVAFDAQMRIKNKITRMLLQIQ